MPEFSVQEIEAARKIIAASQQNIGTKNTKLPREYHGPIDLSYERPAPTEFPKMVYKVSTHDPKGYVTRVIQSQEEQDKLPKGWLTTSAEVHALLDPIAKAQYVDPDDVKGTEPEEKEASRKVKQDAKDAKGK